MNFEPRTILPASLGNNADARTTTVRVMNERDPSPQQLAWLGRQFNQHMANLRLTIVGFLTDNGLLPDGSAYRIVSNSGLHVVMIWPAGGTPPLEEPGDWFRAIPASDTLRSGTGSKPSWGWKFPAKLSSLTSWPSKHKAISLRIDHPGHVTWSNPNLKVNGKPIVVTWRGPRERYAATTGHAGPTGGGITSHERNPPNFPALAVPIAIGDEVFIDGPYVWINGHKVNTGVEKVIAACLHEYDPSGHPDQFVLRVCADKINGFSPRQMVVYDLVPTSGADGGSLKSFAQASATLFVKTSYVAAENTNNANRGGSSTTPGEWDYWQRPHFNRTGNRLATLICKVGADGSSRESHAVSFDPTTWIVDDDITASISIPVDTGYVTAGDGLGQTRTFNWIENYFVACDFEGDTFVYVELVVEENLTQTAYDAGPLAGSARQGYLDLVQSFEYTINHSAIGQLQQWTETGETHLHYTVTPAGAGNEHIDAAYTWEITNGTRNSVSAARVWPHMEFAFVGDLSKRVFALGYRDQDTQSSYSAAGTINLTRPTAPGSYPQIPVTVSRQRSFLVFDVYFDGVRIAEAVSGAYAATGVETETGSYGESLAPADMFTPTNPPSTSDDDTQGLIARYTVALSPVGPPSFEGRQGSTGGTNRAAAYSYGAAPQHQHCAVHPEKAAAYLGAAYFKDNASYGGTTPLPQGIELFVLKPGDTPSTENPTAYITGDHPTLSAPVFMGVGSKSGETT